MRRRRLDGRAAAVDICYKTSNLDKNGQEEAKKLLISGAALVKFKEIIREQGGNPDVKSETQSLQITNTT